MKAVKGKYYFGGVHPHDMKSISKDAALEVLPASGIVAISTSQSLGLPYPQLRSDRKSRKAN